MYLLKNVHAANNIIFSTFSFVKNTWSINNINFLDKIAPSSSKIYQYIPKSWGGKVVRMDKYLVISVLAIILPTALGRINLILLINSWLRIEAYFYCCVVEGRNCYQCSPGDDGLCSFSENELVSCADNDGCGKGSFYRFQCNNVPFYFYFNWSERTGSHLEFRGCCGAILEAGPFDNGFSTGFTCTPQEDFDEDGGYMSKDVNTCCCRGELWVQNVLETFHQRPFLGVTMGWGFQLILHGQLLQ